MKFLSLSSLRSPSRPRSAGRPARFGFWPRWSRFAPLLLAAGTAFAQTTVTFTNGQTNTTDYDISGSDFVFTIASGSATQSGALTGNDRLSKTGAGTLVLSGSSTFTGRLFVEQGTLALGSAASIGTPNRIYLASGATIDAGTFDFNLDRFDSNPTYHGTVTGSGVFSAAPDSFSSKYVLHDLTGSASLLKSGDGTLHLYGNNTFSGGTTIQAGSVIFGKVTSVGTGGITVASGATAGFNLGGTGEFTSLDDALSRATFAPGARLAVSTDNAPGSTFTDSGSHTGDYGLSMLWGTLVLTGTNTFAGGVSLDNIYGATTLQLGSAGAIGDSGTITFNGGTLRWSAANTTDYSARFSTADYQSYGFDTGGQNITLATALSSNSSSLTKHGAGTLTLSAPASGVSYVSVEEGTLDLGGHTLPVGYGITLGSIPESTPVAGNLTNGTLALAANADSGVTILSGTLGVTLTGTGDYLRLWLGGGGGQIFLNGTNDLVNSIDHASAVIGANGYNNSYGSTVTLGNANALAPATENAHIDAGTLDLNGIANVRANSIQMTGNNDTARLVNDNTASTASFAGGVNLGANWRSEIGGAGTLVLSGEVSGEHFTKIGAGTLTLTGANTFTGDTTIVAGTLQIGAGGTSGTLAGANVANHGTLAFNRSDAVSFSHVISGSGSLVQAGSGTLTLSGANTYTGDTTVTAGSLVLSGSGRLGSGTVYVENGGTLDLGGTTQTVAGLGSLEHGIIGTLTGGTINTTGYVVLQSGTSDVTFTGSGANARLWLGGDSAGTLTLNGTNDMVYTADHNQVIIGLLLPGGTVQVGNAHALAAASENVHVFTGTLDLNGVANVRANSIILQSGADSLLVNNNTGSAASFAGGVELSSFDSAIGGAGDLTLSGAVTGDGGLNKIGAGTLTLSGNNFYFSGTTVTAGTLQLGDSGTNIVGDVTVNGGTFALGAANATIGRLAGSGGVVELFHGTGRTLTVGDGDGDSTFAGRIQGSGGALVKTGAGTLTLSGDNTYTGGTTLSAGTLALGSTGALGSAGTIAFGGGTLQFSAANTADYSARFSTAASQAYRLDTNGQNVALASALTSTGGSLTKLGSGTLTLSAANTYTDGTTIAAGTLIAGNASAFGTGAVRLDAGTLDLGGYAVANALDVRGGTLTGLAAYTGTQTVRTAVSYSGNVGGALVLASGGSLNTTGATFTGNLTIQNGATLGGTGTVAFATIDAGGVLAPGNSPGTITYTNGLTLHDGAILNFELGTTSDLIRVSGGTLTGSASAGGITLNLSDAGSFTAASYALFDFSGATTSSFSVSDFTFGSTIAGYTYSLALVGDTLQLTAAVSAVPEPATCAALFGACALALATLRRRAQP